MPCEAEQQVMDNEYAEYMAAKAVYDECVANGGDCETLRLAMEQAKDEYEAAKAVYFGCVGIGGGFTQTATNVRSRSDLLFVSELMLLVMIAALLVGVIIQLRIPPAKVSSQVDRIDSKVDVNTAQLREIVRVILTDRMTYTQFSEWREQTALWNEGKEIKFAPMPARIVNIKSLIDLDTDAIKKPNK